jgi:IS605 OrfB family transposase
MHKLTTELAGSFPDAEHRFERLEKRGMFNGSRAHNRRLVKADWSTIRSMLSYKAGIGEPLNPQNSTRRCSRCGGKSKAPKGSDLRAEGGEAAERSRKPLPSDGGAFSNPKALR